MSIEGSLCPVCHRCGRQAQQSHMEMRSLGGEHVSSGEKFKPINARIHLAAERTYGICGNLCRATDDHARGRQQQFRTLIKKLAKKKAEKLRKHKQQDARIQQRADASKKKRQPKIGDSLKADASDAANFAVAQWAIAHDIPANALKGPYWRKMNTQRCLTQLQVTSP